MRAGKLTEVVRLQQRNEVGEVTGGTWSDVITFRAQVTPQIGSALEGFPAEALRAATIYKVSARWAPWSEDVKIDQRLLWGEKILNIENVFNVDSANREMLLMCQEGMNRG